jgi:nucleotide-binding universal stress UspA family protein
MAMKSAELQIENSVSLKSILFATDLSPASASAFAYAAEIARANRGKLKTVCVVPGEARMAVPLDPLPLSMDRQLMEAEAGLKQLVGDPLLGGVEHSELLRRGEVVEVLAKIIEQEHPDLLVIGTHARTGMKKLFIGSIAEELFRMASCPVLTVRPALKVEHAHLKPLHTILFATDFGPASLCALPYAIALANEGPGKLVMLHVVPPVPVIDVGPYWYPGTDLQERQEEDRKKSLARLRHLIDSQANVNCTVEQQISFNLMPGAILQAVAGCHADLIVMGVKGSGIGAARTSAHLPWATAHEIVCHAPCPVLTVRD